MPNNVNAHLEDGRVKTVAVKSIADVKAPTLAELTADGAVDLSYWLTSDGWKLTHSQDMIDDDREGAAAVGQIPGQEKYTDGTMQVLDNVNVMNGNTPESNDAVEQLVQGSKWYIVRRRGADTDSAWKEGEKVSVFPVTIGIRTPVAHAANQRQLSTISFSADPASRDETAVIAPKA
ncbi:hypothetical protein [Bifidobacterium scardovii]|uniref:Gp28 n=1 Tax=Bifidobacterium scardovii TaxID=158787 RepID=A0A087DGN0_9BIFI|nr:hypothetical protein [Bifidobacterium scardovii]KFI94680.1 gp28 [Bifidobacterium scardovii]MDK6349818.1 hypothetical protein [Bifidobacterium scardovii]MDU8982522.1 hypothetical protein [Bifidobacterium scardovii]BAQ32089.1 hypothetical protein BBSC_2009 [Bifidobacterium scardovii JCM 12489 = DSM 13734]